MLILILTACPANSVPGTPVIVSFSATPSVLSEPQEIKLEWQVTGATELEIDGGVGAVTPPDKGSKSVYVYGAKTFVLKAKNAQGEVSKSLRIEAPGPTLSLVETVAGQAGVRGGADGPGSSATFNYPYGVAVTKDAGATGGEVIVYIVGLNEKIRYALVGYAGNPVGTAIGKGESGSVDGDANTALVRAPQGIAIGYDSPAYEAYAYWTEDDSCVVRKLTAYPLNGNRKAVTVAGKAYTCGAADGSAAAARFNRPTGIVANTRTGEVFVADTSNYTIRRIYGDSVSTFAGLAGQPGTADGPGASARFLRPSGIALNRQEELLVADNTSVRKITPDGQVSTLAGKPGEFGYKDGLGSEARFNGASGIAVDEVGNIYVSEDGNHTIRKITPDGQVSTVAGIAGVTGAADGSLSVATFNRPWGLAYYNKQLFVADTYNQTIRRIR
ncbi:MULTISPECIES: alkaline phosphatase PhoX [unclassified Meiothermus]|uniref:alkaline phosphatase PhoX n=1 Tax=unclassified Meiothermus TaxID=370471 RepID=UPI0013144E9E|nr:MULTISPECIES: alkaline phosphatase PhoX [unclassified Meiothermus]